MSKYESSVRQIPYKVESVYSRISDLSNLQKVADRIPQDKISDFQVTADTISFSANPVGTVKLQIVDRTPLKCVKLQTVDSPMPFTFWIQVLPTSDASSKMRLTIEAEINLFLRKMIEKPLKDGLEKIADMLAAVPYE
ncbi:MAG: SRPBCC family protein [Bacteroidaceae bacterium]|nr:SRPBCC family protein [Bacteroidaceae bacterium]